MIILIHGNDITSSRDYYFEQKNQNPNGIQISGEGLTYEQFFQNAESTSLFDDKKTLLIEDFFSKNKSNTIEFKKITEYINKNNKLNIVFWESTELSKANQSIFKTAAIKVFSYPQVLFTFLDNLRPNNQDATIKLVHDLSKNMEIELIFFMLIRQFRLMLNQLDNSTKIDELRRMAPWQTVKLERQAKLFGLNKLKSAYSKLFEMDLALKTGKIPYSLERSIDFFLADL